MKSTKHPYDQCSAPDALLEQVERDLLALTTVPLDIRDGEPRQCVDEFANEFLIHWSMPPRRRCHSRR
jgi:hypothetical protein